MSVVPHLDIKEGDKVLDMCAAPGGKSTYILSKLNDTGLLVSNEINPTRIRARITAGNFVPDIYVVTLSDNPGNILEILPAGMLVQRSARATCPLIVGMARGKSGAIQMVQDMIEQVYTETGNFKIKEYLKNR